MSTSHQSGHQSQEMLSNIVQSVRNITGQSYIDNHFSIHQITLHQNWVS